MVALTNYLGTRRLDAAGGKMSARKQVAGGPAGPGTPPFAGYIDARGAIPAPLEALHLRPGDLLVAIGRPRAALSWKLPELTVRDGEIVREVAAGSGNKRIAARLGMSLSAVKKHIERISRRLGTRGRAHLAATAALLAAGLTADDVRHALEHEHEHADAPSPQPPTSTAAHV